MGEETTIMGTVLSVVFQNEENGYAVLRLVTDDGELLTLVGCVPCAAPGENLTATGSFFLPTRSTASSFPRARSSGICRRTRRRFLNYLASGVVRGVGPATAEKLVTRFGIETLQVLESEPEKLTAIKGMTARRAQEISNAFNEQMGLRRVMEFLAHYDLPAALSVPLYRRFRRKRHGRARAQPLSSLRQRVRRGLLPLRRDRALHGLWRRRVAPHRGGADIRALPQPRRGRTRLPPARKPRRDGPAFDCDVDAVEKASTISSPSTASCRKASRT